MGMATKRIEHFAKGVLGKYLGHSVVHEDGEIEHFENDGSFADGVTDGRYAGRSVIEKDGRVVRYGPSVLDGQRGVSQLPKQTIPKHSSGGGGGGGGFGGSIGESLAGLAGMSFVVFFGVNLIIAFTLLAISMLTTGGGAAGIHWQSKFFEKESEILIAVMVWALEFAFKAVVFIIGFGIIGIFILVPIGFVCYFVYSIVRSFNKNS
jgi:hypothetical protein